MIFHSKKTLFNYTSSTTHLKLFVFFLSADVFFALCTRTERRFCFLLNFFFLISTKTNTSSRFHLFIAPFSPEKLFSLRLHILLILLSFNWFYLRVYCLIISPKFDSRYETPLNFSATVPENFFFSARTKSLKAKIDRRHSKHSCLFDFSLHTKREIFFSTFHKK